MNTIQLNPIIALSEAELLSTIEFTYPLFMFMILVAAMTSVTPQKIKKSICSKSKDFYKRID